MAALVLIAAVVGTYLLTQSWLVAGVAGVVPFVVSAFLHPYVRCGACKGSGRHRGAVFNYASRPCHACNGAGRKQRFTAARLGRGQQTRSGPRIVPATKSFGRRR